MKDRAYNRLRNIEHYIYRYPDELILRVKNVIKDLQQNVGDILNNGQKILLQCDCFIRIIGKHPHRKGFVA